MSLVAFKELTKNINLRSEDKIMLWICYLAIPLQMLIAYKNNFSMFLIFMPILMYIVTTFKTVISGNVNNITRSASIIHWVAMLTIFSFSHIVYIISLPSQNNFSAGNGALILFLVLITELNDIFQYATGKIFGKRKIASTLSPNKTLEGFIGGLFLTTITGYLLNFLLPIGIVGTILLTVLICIVGFFGDLTLSAVKRENNVKDMGTCIPGHGGIMDRCDSLAFTSIVFFYFIKYTSY